VAGGALRLGDFAAGWLREADRGIGTAGLGTGGSGWFAGVAGWGEERAALEAGVCGAGEADWTGVDAGA